MSAATDIFQIFEAAATVIAIIVGGYWTYILFVKRRIDFPRSNIEHRVTHRIISDRKLLLHVDVTISNVGDTLVQLVSGEMRIQQMVPPPEEVLTSLNEDRTPVEDGRTEVDWPLVDSRKITWAEGQFEIEPGERDEVPYDFFVDTDIETVEVYSYFQNARKVGRDIGWGHTTIYDLKSPGLPTQSQMEEVR